ncbi:RHS repeat-associated core domain-containing protein, partial [Akkermansia sp. N21169]|uniref:RHS repeat domain-containing protein n=1 Tax=Akkermansia sp. N21169 TaxID=3040765 RepID=UPI00244EEB3D
TGEWSLVWNAERRPVTWTSADGKTVVTSAYDSMGRRCRRQVRVNGTLTRDERYLYRGYLRIATLDALNGDALLHAILWDPSEPEATRPLGLTTSDGTHYSYGHDFTKNVTEMLDETGRLVASYEYDPYGRTVIESGSCAHANPLGFSSEITDRETGTMYYNYRDYNPTDGRWLTRDPIGEQGGRNLYGFVGNSVNIYIDYMGLDIIQDLINLFPDRKHDGKCCSIKTKTTIKLVMAGMNKNEAEIYTNAKTIMRFNKAGKIYPVAEKAFAGVSKSITSASSIIAYAFYYRVFVVCDCQSKWFGNDGTNVYGVVLGPENFGLQINDTTNGFNENNPFPPISVLQNKFTEKYNEYVAKAISWCEGICSKK